MSIQVGNYLRSRPVCNAESSVLLCCCWGAQQKTEVCRSEHGDATLQVLADDPCCCRSDDDPDGNIVMSIAENRLSVDLIRQKLQASHDIPDTYFFYDNMTGSQKLKLGLIGLLQHTFMQVSSAPFLLLFACPPTPHLGV